jgi:RES domain-containing protein
MEVCPKCFTSGTLQKYIESEGEEGDCPTCGTKGTTLVDAGELRDLFEPLSKYYQVAEPGEHYIYDPEEGRSILGDEGEPLDQLLQEDWSIFSDKVDQDDISRLLDEAWPGFDSSSGYASDDLWYTSPDEDFQSLAERLMHERRFFPKEHDPEPGVTSIDRLLEHRLEDFAQRPTQTEWFRGHRHEIAAPHVVPDTLAVDKIGAPPRERVLRGGRANPAGIAYLYLGSSAETVIAELRSIPGDYVSIGTFTLGPDLLMIDLNINAAPLDPLAHEDLRWEIERRALLRDFGRRLSRPIRNGEHELEYVVTQYLAEFIASKGYAGIIYPSAMSKGANLVLFDPRMATCAQVCQYKVTRLDVNYGFRAVTDHDRNQA